MRRCICGVVVWGALCGCADDKQALRRVQDELAAKLASHKTMQWKEESWIDDPWRVPSTCEYHKTVATVNQEGKVLCRFDSTRRDIWHQEPVDMKMEIQSSSVYDGQRLWDLTNCLYQNMDSDGSTEKEIEATVEPWRPINLFNAAGFAEDNERFTFTLLQDEKVNGKDCYTIERKARHPRGKLVFRPVYRIEKYGFARVVSYYDKASGLRIRNVGYDRHGQLIYTDTKTDIKIDEPVDPERFVFKAPPGVEIQDLTRPAEPKAVQNTASAAEEPPLAWIWDWDTLLLPGALEENTVPR